MPLQISLAHQFEQQQEETSDLTFSPDGRQLVSSDGNALYLWRLNENGVWNYERSLLFRNTAFPRFVTNEEMFAFVGEKAFIKLVSLDGREVATFPCPPYVEWALSPDLRWLVSGDKGRTILLWDLMSKQNSPILIPILASDQNEKNVDLSNENVCHFLFTPDGQRLVFSISSSQGGVHIGSFDQEHRHIIRQKTIPVVGMLEGAIAPNGQILAMIVPNEQTFAYKQEIYIYNLDSLQLMHVFPQTTNERYCLLAFSPDSQYLMSCKSDGSIDIFSLNSFSHVVQFAAHPGLFSGANDPIGGLAWSKTGYIATGGASVFEKNMSQKDYSIKIWKVEL